MGDVADEAQHLSLLEDGHGEIDVGQVRASRHERVVCGEDVAFLHGGERMLGEERVEQSLHGAEVNGQRVVGLGDETAPRVHEGRRMIVTFLDVGGVGTLHQSDVGLVGDRPKSIGNDLERHRIDLERAHDATSTIMLRAPSTVARSPG